MKKLFSALMIFCIAIAMITFNAALGAAEDSFLKIPVGVSYSSVYWWRGVELYGKNNGVVWGNAGVELGSTGITLNFAAGLAEDYLMNYNNSDGSYRDYQKSLTEFDYVAGFSHTFADLIALSLGAAFIQYHFYDEVAGATDPSFWEGSFGLALKTVLNPSVTVYYDYYVEETASKTPRDEDYYVKLAVSQDLVSQNDFTFSAGAWAGYYNNAYLERKGWSDAGVTLGIAQKVGNATFKGAVNYARSLSSDFQITDTYNTEAGKLRNHLWADFGISYSL